ncbi:hypothetical protein JO375_01420 [Paenibacillus sp. UY79]|nr:hypothetical protein [Paenibacillus farraposensis]
MKVPTAFPCPQSAEEVQSGQKNNWTGKDDSFRDTFHNEFLKESVNNDNQDRR